MRDFYERFYRNDYTATIRELGCALRPGGQMAFLYSHGREPWVPLEEFDVETLPADKTPLAVALQTNGHTFETQEFTADDYRLALLRKQVLAELKPQFEAEDIMFIYDNRMGDANGVSQACEMGLQRRYLYLAR